MYDKHFVGLDLTGFEGHGLQRPISRVTLLLDDKNVVTAGDDTGIELSADCPHATQAMADSILFQVKGYRYQMFSADDAGLDPAAELGDGITAGGVYSVISRIASDGSGYASVTAPGEEELEDEYPAAGPMTKAFQRQIAETRSLILKTANSITLRVENQLKAVYSELTIELDSITSTVQGLDGEISSVRQYANQISAKVTDLNGTVEVTLDTLDGLTVRDSSGTTRIKGSSIDTSTIRANSIDADCLNLRGSITFSDLSRDMQNDFDDAYSMAEDAQSLAYEVDRTVGGWCYPGTTEIDGRSIRTGTVTATTLEGGEIYLLDYYGRRAGAFTLEGASSYSGQKVVMESGGIELHSMYGSLFLQSGSGANIELSDCGEFGCDIAPDRGGAHSCGRSNRQWSDIYAANDVIQTSDRARKTGINYGLSAYDAFFDALRPVSYRFTDGQSGRTHLGLIAQDVEAALEACGLTGMDFAGFVKSPRVDGTGQVIEGEFDYALRYGEFIPLCIRKIQTLTARVAELERRAAS